MTIIQPHKSNRKTNFWISIFMVGSLSAAGWGVSLYNQIVSLRHEVKIEKETLRQAEIYNAELKDKLYNLTDTNNISSSTNTQSMILDKNPEYVKVNSLVANN